MLHKCPIACLEIRKKYYEENKEKEKLRKKKYYEENPQARIARNLRRRVRGALKSQGAIKSKKTEELLGCSVKFFIEHLESLFDDKMTFENYGEWHIDHIMPCVSFDLTKIKEQKRCFNYTNQQPLWGSDNLSKGSKLDWNQKDDLLIN